MVLIKIIDTTTDNILTMSVKRTFGKAVKFATTQVNDDRWYQIYPHANIIATMDDITS